VIRNTSRDDVELVDIIKNDEAVLIATEIDGVSVTLQVRRDASSRQLDAATVDALQEARHQLALDPGETYDPCSADSVPDSEDIREISTGEPIPDGGVSYCSECHRAVAHEDRVERDGAVYHSQCAPDDVVDHETLDRFEEGPR
jgi:hypothetical protein